MASLPPSRTADDARSEDEQRADHQFDDGDSGGSPWRRRAALAAAGLGTVFVVRRLRGRDRQSPESGASD